ncbi:SGNH/GDSL hydrolase family protein [Algibacter sp.]|uniref:SGNH/GDSL hydrolase family protein n=1 Tax=Algibacter sp. TaxID=1872428 RepID=UPI003C73C8C3
MIFRFLKHLLSITFILCFALQSFGQNQQESYSILFIGNSLTSTNDLPNLIKTRAKYSGYHLETEMIAEPNYSISDHWKKGHVQKLIKSRKFDIVIIQQGPSSQPHGKKMLIEYGKKYQDICKENHALLAYFMVWPSLDNYDSFENVIKNYELAAEINNAILLPVGSVWENYFESSKKFDYYGPDNFHPSNKGSEIAANVITKILTKHLKKP